MGEGEPEKFPRSLGMLPIMCRYKRCNLRGMSRTQLIARGEEGGEVGGYFLCNGNERAIRLLAYTGIPAPEARFSQYPHQFSGGQPSRPAAQQNNAPAQNNEPPMDFDDDIPF